MVALAVPVLLLECLLIQFVVDTDRVLSSENRVRVVDMLAANRLPLSA